MTYRPKQFSDLFESKFGRDLWDFLTERDNTIRMETATYLVRPAVEPLSPYLLSEFGERVLEARTKQMIGHMVRQIMESRSFKVGRTGVRITKANVFASGTRYVSTGTEEELNRMKGFQEVTHNRYIIKAGIIKNVSRAVVLHGGKKILESSGSDVFQAIESCKNAVDARDAERQNQRREPHIGTVDDYVEALRIVNPENNFRKLLVVHSRSPNQTMTATELADAVGYESYSAVNAVYGKLGKDIAEAAGLPSRASDYQPDEYTHTFTLASGEGEKGEHWKWIMHPELLEALKITNII